MKTEKYKDGTPFKNILTIKDSDGNEIKTIRIREISEKLGISRVTVYNLLEGNMKAISIERGVELTQQLYDLTGLDYRFIYLPQLQSLIERLSHLKSQVEGAKRDA